MELTSRTCNTERENTERLFARGFVILGGLFWAVMLAASIWGYAHTPIGLGNQSLIGVVALLLIIVTFVVGLYYEYIAAILLFIGAFLIAVYGVLIGQWQDPGVWVTMAIFFVAPMVVGGILYLLAARMQKTCELEEARTAS